MAEITRRIYVGIDVSKGWLDIAVLPSGETWRTPNTPSSMGALVERLEKLKPERIVLEATGGYERQVAAQLDLVQLPLARVNPQRVRDFARSRGQLAKTDQLHAKGLACWGERLPPALTHLSTEPEWRLSARLTRPEPLSGLWVAERNRLDTAPAARRPSLNEQIPWLKNQLKQLDRDMDAFIDQTPQFKEQDTLLQEVQGIGKKTAAKLIAAVPELGEGDRQEMAAWIGTAPYHHDRGKSRGARALRGGRPDVRSVLYRAT